MLNLAQLKADAEALGSLYTTAVGVAQVLDATMLPGTPGKIKMDTLVAGMQGLATIEGVLAAEFTKLWPLAVQMVEGFLAAKKAVQSAAAIAMPPSPPPPQAA